MFRQRLTDATLKDVVYVLKQVDSQHLVLDLGCNELTDDCVDTLADLFQSKTVNGLSLRGNRFTQKSCAKLAEIIETSRLRFLSLAENDLNDGTEAITLAIFNAPALHYGVFGQDCQPYG